MAPFYIDFHCTLEEHQSWSQNREILLGKPSAHRSTPDVVVLFGRGAGDADPAFGFMGNIHIQGSGALLIPYGVTRPPWTPQPPYHTRWGSTNQHTSGNYKRATLYCKCIVHCDYAEHICMHPKRAFHHMVRNSVFCPPNRFAKNATTFDQTGHLRFVIIISNLPGCPELPNSIWSQKKSSWMSQISCPPIPPAPIWPFAEIYPPNNMSAN